MFVSLSRFFCFSKIIKGGAGNERNSAVDDLYDIESGGLVLLASSREEKGEGLY
jgi:hypothetical protein